MRFFIDPGKSPGDEMHRIVSHLAKRAFRNTRKIESETSERIHNIRTDMKKIRSLLRMVRPVSNDCSAMKPAWDAASELKDVFGRVRDEEVQAQVKASLPGSRGKCRKKKKSSRPTKAEEASGLRSGEALVNAAKLMDFSRLTLDALLSGLTQTLEDGRIAMLAAAKAEDDTHGFHEWRKRVKDLWYQSAVLRKVSPEARAWCRDASKLSTLLGSEHDLGILAPETAASTPPGAEIHQKLIAIRAGALALGHKLYGIQT